MGSWLVYFGEAVLKVELHWAMAAAGLAISFIAGYTLGTLLQLSRTMELLGVTTTKMQELLEKARKQGLPMDTEH